MTIKFPINNSQTELALKIAIEAHGQQYRHDFVTPYINHPISVANRVYLRYGNQIDKIATALLHDSIEDSDGKVTREILISRGVKENIVDAIVLLTKTKDTDYENYLARIAENEIACNVKIEDMIDNLSDKPSLKQISKYGKGLQFLVSSSIGEFRRGKGVEKF